MPIEATPLEQEVLAEALKKTLEFTVLPLVGLLTVTPANAYADEKRTRMEMVLRACFFIRVFLPLESIWRPRKAIKNKGIHR